MLKGKHILLGITGSIAAYKAATLVRCLVKSGAQVKVVMTEMAKQFITPLTMATVSKNPILVEFYNPENGDWNSHVSLGEWADLYLIAPASANTISKMAVGVADNLLLTTYLSAKCPIMLAPAMDLDMYSHKTTQDNLKTLKKNGVVIVEPTAGELASGLIGKGRMEEPEKIHDYVADFFATKTSFHNKKVMITAGPTVEKIDPVRYISNYSTGKMGYCLAEEFRKRGANVILISGPTTLDCDPRIDLRRLESASQMYSECKEVYSQDLDIAVFCAAVADYTVDEPHGEKLKKKGSNLDLCLVPTVDIAKTIGEIKNEKCIHIGFALETNNELENAKAKLVNKNFDLVVLNSLNDEGAGFAEDTNKVSLIFKNGEIKNFLLKSKEAVAEDIVNNIEDICLSE